MPIYEYSCRKCGDVIEKIQKFSDPPLKKHPGCGGAVTKLISQSSFQLKGSGWYVTDYAKTDSRKTAEGGDGKEAAAKPEAGKDTAKKSGGTDAASASKSTSDKGTASKSSGGAKK